MGIIFMHIFANVVFGIAMLIFAGLLYVLVLKNCNLRATRKIFGALTVFGVANLILAVISFAIQEQQYGMLLFSDVSIFGSFFLVWIGTFFEEYLKKKYQDSVNKK